MKRFYNSFYFCLSLSKSLGGINKFKQALLCIKFISVIIICKFVKYKFILNLEYRKVKFTFAVDNRMDLAVLGEIFINKEYEFNYINMSAIGESKVILDLGANVGDTAIFYSILFPKAKVYAIEPNPAVHAKLEDNTRQFKNIIVSKCAISNQTGKINLNFGDSHLGSSINYREQNKESVEVEMYSLTDFCFKEKIDKIDILKFDIEGAEEMLLQDSFIENNVVNIVGEVHHDLTSDNIENIISNLKIQNKITKQISKNRYIVFGQVNLL